MGAGWIGWLAALPAMLAAAAAAGSQDPAQVRRAVEDYLQVQTRGLPGEASFVVGAIDAGNRLTPCPALEASLPPGARAWGRTSVLVQCRGETAWSLYVPVQVKVVGDYLVAARPLAQGQIVTPDDLLVQRGDLAELPAGVLTSTAQAVGSSAGVGILAGRPLRSDLLRRPLAIKAGQSVKVVSRGPGFTVAVDGKALANGIEGQVVQARTPSGQTLSGIARNGGLIEINH